MNARDDRESRRLLSGPGCACTLNCSDTNQLAELTSSVLDFFFRVLLTSLASGSAITVREGVPKFTLVVDNDTTVHDAHKDTVAFSPSVLIKCSICSCPQTLTRTPHEWLKKTIHGI